MPSTRAPNSMRAQLTRAQLTPAQLLAKTFLSLAIPPMLLPTSSYFTSTPSPPIMPCTTRSHPQIIHPNHTARNTPQPPATHTKHTSPLPALLDGTGLVLQMSSKKTTTPKVKQSRIRAERSHTRDTRKPQNTHEPHTKPPRHNDKNTHQSGNNSTPDVQNPPFTHTRQAPLSVRQSR